MLSPGEIWYITNNISENGEKKLRNVKRGELYVPQEGWQVFDEEYFEKKNLTNCNTVRLDWFKKYVWWI